MVLIDWVLPIMIGIVAAIALISILYNNPKVKAYFTDILEQGKCQCQGQCQCHSSNLNNYKTKIWKPIPYNQNETIDIPENEYIKRKIACNIKQLDNTNLKITNTDSPLYTKNKMYPIYNSYPKT